MSRLIIDAMGGDYGPRAILDGIIQALPELCQDPGELIIVGDQHVLQPLLGKRRYNALANALDQSNGSSSSFKISLLHASEAIDMEDSVRAVRSKPNSTINVGCQLAAKSYVTPTSPLDESDDPSAFISAGHSGAVMASALLYMGRLPHVERPAIAVTLPTLSKKGCILIDVGANVDCKPEHLRDFAMMGAIYSHAGQTTSSLPRIALLSNGEERKKGNELTRSSALLIEKLKCFEPGPDAIGEFVGYIEGKGIFRGEVDVVVTDGFVGNVVLKSLEGLASAITALFQKETKFSPFKVLNFLLAWNSFAKFKKRLDYAEYGAAPLLGVAGYVFICHGRSNPRAIKNALLHARTALKGRFVERLEKTLQSTAQ